jgi:hypothetical protein
MTWAGGAWDDPQRAAATCDARLGASMMRHVLSRAAICTVAALLLVPAAAHAAGTVTLEGPTNQQLMFVGGVGDANAVTFTGAAGVVTITDAAAVINEVEALCTGGGTHTVTCTGSPIDFAYVLRLEDMDDTAVADGPLGGALYGGAGDDHIVGSDGDASREYLYGDAGNDTLETRGAVTPAGVPYAAGDGVYGGDGNDRLVGGSGDDGLYGDAGVDVISAGAGDDFVRPGLGDGDQVDAGEGGDTVLAFDEDGTGDVLDGGAGADLIVYQTEAELAPGAPVDSFAVDLTAGTAVQTGGGAQSDTIRNFEDVTSDLGTDTLVGTEASNDLYAGFGDDVVDARAGADQIDLGAGDDRAATRDGFTDLVRCGRGNDSIDADQLDVLSDCENATVTYVTPAGSDVTAPVCQVTGVRTRYSRKAFGTGPLARVTCNEPASVSLRLVVRVSRAQTIAVSSRAGDLTLAERALPVGTGTRSVRLKPGTRLLRALPRRFRATVKIDARDALGNQRSLTRSIQVR